MICKQCEANNSDEAFFCQKCGKQLQALPQDEPILIAPQPVSNENTQLRQIVSNKSARKQSGNQQLWIVLGMLVVLLGGLAVMSYAFRQNSNATSYNQTTSDGSVPGNTQSNADPGQIQGVIQQFCNYVVSKDYQSAWGLLSRKEQYTVNDVSGLAQHLATDFGTNYYQQHGYSGGAYTVTGCTTNGLPLVTQGSEAISTPTRAQQHIVWTFSDNAQTPGEVLLVYEDGAWKIDNFNTNATSILMIRQVPL
jgi:hypothetical protein